MMCAECNDTSHTCDGCGEYWFGIQCDEWHSIRMIVEAAIAVRDWNEADDPMQLKWSVLFDDMIAAIDARRGMK